MGRNILGVFVGVVTDIVVSMILGLLFGVLLGAYELAQGVHALDLVAHPNKFVQQAPALLAEAGLGAFGSLVGGFVTGWIARTNRVVCGIIMGCGSVLVSLPFWYASPLWYNILGAFLTIGMATAGAFAAEALLGRTLPPAPPR
jgi:hypothetical protein